MKVAVTLPQFAGEVEPALEAARRAEVAGLDGVFVFDHLWAIGRPERPALTPFPLLGALASETETIALGTLVARVGLFPDAVLVHHFATLQRMVGNRLIAGLGTGDALSAPENVAFGAGYPPTSERLAALSRCCRRLRDEGITTWVGGRSRRTVHVAERDADALNLWDASPAQLRAVKTAPVTWGGIVPEDPHQIAPRLEALRAAGATWAVCGAPRGPDAVIEAVRTLEWVGPETRREPSHSDG